MKRIIDLCLICTMLLLAAACGKHSNSVSWQTIVYSVQNADIYAGHMSAPVTVSLHDDNEYDELLNDFLDHVASGYTVTFYNPDIKPVSLKKTGGDGNNQRTISTKSRETLKDWCRDMEGLGLTVVISYDDSTGTWNGYAYATSPSSLSDMPTYMAYANGLDENYSVIMTADLSTQKLYISYRNYGNTHLCINQGVVNYNWFNAADSGFTLTTPATMLFMRNVINDSLSWPAHYAVLNWPGFNFDQPSFTLENVDSNASTHPLSVSFAFTSTTEYETWVCMQDDINIVMHVDRSSIDTASYSFSAQFSVQTDVSELPFFNGEIDVQGGDTSDEYDETCTIVIPDGDDFSFGVELITDDLVIWNINGYVLRFVRIR